jgi:hypothetical protein
MPGKSNIPHTEAMIEPLTRYQPAFSHKLVQDYLFCFPKFKALLSWLTKLLIQAFALTVIGPLAGSPFSLMALINS